MYFNTICSRAGSVSAKRRTSSATRTLASLVPLLPFIDQTALLCPVSCNQSLPKGTMLSRSGAGGENLKGQQLWPSTNTVKFKCRTISVTVDHFVPCQWVVNTGFQWQKCGKLRTQQAKLCTKYAHGQKFNEIFRTKKIIRKIV